MLTNLLAIMDKAETNAAERKFDTAIPAEVRLSLDMIPFRGQVMIATDRVKGCVSRLAGREIPSWPDTEKTFDELRARIGRALDLLATIQSADLDGSETREAVLKLGGNDVRQNGLDYLVRRALPNLYFHVTIAYAILRASESPHRQA
ncbi:MAG: DUF1993 domain-containing protein [Candidatus Devosia euplotis]|nr:DUF1993 domain-containing protein [Candidatus Devosia euplotis]